MKVIGLSVDATSDHEAWAQDIEESQGTRPNFPMIGDVDFNVSKLYGMLPAATSGDAKQRTPADNQTVRNVFVIGPDKKIKLILVYPMTTGRNFDEVLRVIDSLQLTAQHRVATPVNWKQGEDVVIAGSVSNDEAKEIFGEWKSPKPYIRIVPQPHADVGGAQRTAPCLLEAHDLVPVAARARAGSPRCARRGPGRGVSAVGTAVELGRARDQREAARSRPRPR